MSRLATIARSASVIGREHVRLGRNNQDGHCCLSEAGLTVGVVTDGCSSEPFSEVGARWGARALAHFTLELARTASLDAVPALACSRLIGWLEAQVAALGGDGARALVEQYLLFTVLAVVQKGDQTLVFGSGDGSVWLDGRLLRLDSGPRNAPRYLGYRLLGEDLEPQLHHLGAARRVAVATDGLDDWLARTPDGLATLLDDAVVWSNPVHLQRRLAVLHETERFTDDSTLVALDTKEL